MSHRHSHKFDPARAHLLDSPERNGYLPDQTLVDLLELEGGETVLDYGAGTGRVALAAAERLPRGRVIAVEENAEMLKRLATHAQGSTVEVIAIAHNRVPLKSASVDRILAINMLHEVRGENALGEMYRLLAPHGFALVVDWDRERPGEPGPPAEHRYTRAEAVAELSEAGFEVQPLEPGLPYHFALRARAQHR